MKSRLLYIACLLMTFWSCQPANQVNDTDYIPNTVVNVQINLNDITYSKLKVDKGWVYLNGGLRGIIVYREAASNYKAFERMCSYKPSNTCARVKVDGSNFYMLDSCCSSYFDFSGNPTSGPAFRPLKQYLVTQDNYILYINN
ncbi:MAG: hypothetical protein K2Q22_09325 [Cytophagales bacterium]|nr:hypothetical protein [Cytophagales bacterium]